MPNLHIPPHADVRVICDDLGRLRAGLSRWGLAAPAVDAAIDMLTRLSLEVHAVKHAQSGGVENDPQT